MLTLPQILDGTGLISPSANPTKMKANERFFLVGNEEREHTSKSGRAVCSIVKHILNTLKVFLNLS